MLVGTSESELLPAANVVYDYFGKNEEDKDDQDKEDRGPSLVDLEELDDPTDD